MIIYFKLIKIKIYNVFNNVVWDFNSIIINVNNVI